MGSGRLSITADDHGPLINILSWILLVVSCLATFVKVYSKWSIMRILQADDYYLSVATLTAVGWVIAISLQVTAGLGRHEATLSSDQIDRFQQAAFASQILYVISLCLAKMAILHFLLSLARKNNRRLAVQATMVFNLVSVVVGVFAIAFQCPVPQTWTVLSDKCFNQDAFWDAFGAMDILVDFATVILPFFLLHDLHLAWSQKLPAIIAFALRALIIPVIIVRLVFLKLAFDSTDHPFDDFNVAIITSVDVNLSVIITCLPFLKTVIDSLQVGLLASDLRSSGPNISIYALGTLARRPTTKGGSSTNKRSKVRGHDDLATADSENEAKEWQQRDNSEEMMVNNHTTTMSVQYQENTV